MLLIPGHPALQAHQVRLYHLLCHPALFYPFHPGLLSQLGKPLRQIEHVSAAQGLVPLEGPLKNQRKKISIIKDA